MTTTAEAYTVLTLVQAAAATAKCLDSRIVAEAAADKAAADDALNADATEVEAHVTTTAGALSAFTLVQAAGSIG